MTALDDLRKLGEFPAVEEWQEHRESLGPTWASGTWQLYELADAAIEELRAEVARLKWIIDAKSTQNQGFSGSFSPDSKCDYARGPSGQREE